MVLAEKYGGNVPEGMNGWQRLMTGLGMKDEAEDVQIVQLTKEK